MLSEVVPYITARAGESSDLDSLASLPDIGLLYPDEAWRDRDHRGVLWVRYSQALGEDGQPCGAPQWSDVHPWRQRETMLHLRCQVCAGPTKTARGYLFLSGSHNGTALPQWPEGALQAQPPLCLEHARLSVRSCGFLTRAGHVAMLVERPQLFGVIGTWFQVTKRGLVDVEVEDPKEPVSYKHPDLRWFLASQLVRVLRDVTIVDLDELELAEAGPVAG